MIVVDCERMNYPFTGLYYFCDRLAASLLKEKYAHTEDLGFYIPQKIAKRWGDDVYYKKKRLFDKFGFDAPANCRLWHATHQLTQYVPRDGKLLLTVHDLNFLYEKTEQKQQKYLRKIQHLIDRANRITVISEFCKQDLLAHIDTGSKKIDVVYNGCNLYEGKIVEPEYKPDGEFLFSISAILPKKNFHTLPCLLQNNDFHLIIAGNKSEYETKIMNEAALYGVSERVHVIGPVSEEHKHWYLSHCKAFVFPSIAEGFGLPVLEAMAYGKPTFLSCHTSLPEIGKEYAYYFNKNFDRDSMKKEFAEGITHFYSGGKDAEEIKRYARSFSWQNSARKYWEIYEEMLFE